MATVAKGHERYAGISVGSGHCVDFVRQAAGAPHTDEWRRGVPVRGADLVPGTCIATFNTDGRYANSLETSHAAILIAQHDDNSITVWDQWLGRPVAQRVIQNREGRGDAVNDASRFHAIEFEP